MSKYSLSDLAWLSRCLFPKNFHEELEALGIDDFIRFDLARAVNAADGRIRNILELYQEFISDQDSIDAIEKYCDWWIQKNKENR